MRTWSLGRALARRTPLVHVRNYRVLAIESSCDDSAVCIIDRDADSVTLRDHMKTALDSAKDGGIIPVDALAHHLGQIAPLVHQILDRNGRPAIDLVCATQGPGMFSSLAAGLQVGKGLAVAWNVPLVGVHHMLGHLLMPRFFSNGQSPQFPFLSLLASGGHTMLVLSRGVMEHEVLIDTIDNAAGNALDKCGRHIGLSGNMIGKELDEFSREKSGPVAELPMGFEFPLPLEKRHNRSTEKLAFSFAQYASLVPRLAELHRLEPLEEQADDIRRAIAVKLQEDMFRHITRKIGLALKRLTAGGVFSPHSKIDLVCSGGVAANSRLRRALARIDAPVDLQLHFVEPKWCTDNALMIGWAGIELHEAGYTSPLGIIPTAKWPLGDLANQITAGL